MRASENPSTRLTYADYCLLPQDGMRHEILDGQHHMNPAPSPRHQTISRRIQFQLYEQIELSGRGQVFDAPIDLQLGDSDIVQPDLVVVLKPNAIVTPTKLHGVPDLIVEILSPSTRNYDRQRKKKRYEQHAVPEYWTIDPDRCVAEQHVLSKERAYETTAHGTRIHYRNLATVDLARVWPLD